MTKWTDGKWLLRTSFGSPMPWVFGPNATPSCERGDDGLTYRSGWRLGRWGVSYVIEDGYGGFFVIDEIQSGFRAGDIDDFETAIACVEDLHAHTDSYREDLPLSVAALSCCSDIMKQHVAQGGQ